MRLIIILAMVVLAGMSHPAVSRCFGKWPAYTCVNESNGAVDTWVRSPGGTVHIEDHGGGTTKLPYAHSSDSSQAATSGTSGTTGVLQPSGDNGGTVMVAPQNSAGGIVLQGAGGGTVVTCGPSGICQ